MKIDEACVDHNAVMLIKDLTTCLYDMVDGEHDRTFALMTLANILGVIEMAEELKKVLKV